MTRTVNVSFVEHNCKFCSHDKAVSKPSGAFCTRCGKEVNENPIELKPMRSKGVHPKQKWRKK